MNLNMNLGRRIFRRPAAWMALGILCGIGLISTPTMGQTDSTWSGGNGSWFDLAMWDAGVPNGAFNAIIDGDAGTNSDVTFDSSSSANVESLTVGAGDSLTIQNNSDFGILSTGSATSGKINNDGQITLDNFGNATDLVINSGDVLLSGAGTFSLAGSSSNSRILDQNGGSDAHFMNSSTLNGHGQIGVNSLQLSNLAGGLIDANSNGRSLLIDANALGMTNAGTMRASNGGDLSIQGSNIDNTGGVIESLADSSVSLLTGASISGGTLQTTGNGQINVGQSQSVTLSDLTIGGNLTQGNNSDLFLGGTITNSSNSFNVGGVGNLTDVVIDSATTLQGGGTMTLSGSNDGSRILDQSASDGVLTNVDNTIQGKGQIGANTLQVINQAGGIIDANDSTGTLTLDPRAADSMVNQGTMRASAGGHLMLTAGGFNNAGGTIEAQADSQVSIFGSASITGGTIQTSGNGAIEFSQSGTTTLTDTTLNGNLNQRNNTDLFLNGTITNQSNDFNVVNAGNLTDIVIDGATNLTGNGTITLGGSTNNSRIVDQSGADGVFTNSNNTIQGRGQIGVNTLAIVNDTDGLIDANVAGASLTLDPRAGGNLTNNGILQASGGSELILSGAGGGGQFLNQNGTIQAQDGSQVRIGSVGSVVGGDLKSFGTGRIVVGGSDNAELDDVTFSGNLDLLNNSDLELFNTLNNQGNVNVSNLGNLTDIQIESDVMLTGGGTITLGGNTGNSRILDEVGSADGVLTNVDNTIQGQGQIGVNRLQVINQGLIDANDAGSLVLNPASTGSQFTNMGTLRASNGSELFLDGSGGGQFLNNGGTIEAQDNSTVRLSGVASVVGGDLNTFGSGQFLVSQSQNAELTDLNLNGNLNVANNSDLELFGTINNNGSIALNTGGNLTDLQIETNVSLTGNGTITLGGTTGNSRILDEVGTADGVLTNVGNTIQGFGVVGAGRLEIINEAGGTFDANVNGQSLFFDSRNGNTNQGSFVASNGGILAVNGDFSNDGFVNAMTNSLVDISGDLVNNELGSLVGNGEIAAASILNEGRIAPGASVGELTLDGNTELASTSLLDIEVDLSGSDLLNVVGELTVGGELSLNLLAGFLPAETDVFTVATASDPILGLFSNVANGEVLETADGGGSFVVNYGDGSAFSSNSIVLSGFAASVPEPGTAAALLALMTSSLLVRRRRS